METKKDQETHVLEIISKLKSEGKTWEQISQVLAEEGLTDKRGKPISASAAQARYLRSQKGSQKKRAQTEVTPSYQYEQEEGPVQIDMDELIQKAADVVMNKTTADMNAFIQEAIEMKLAAMYPPPPAPIDEDLLVQRITDTVMNMTQESMKTVITEVIDERFTAMTPPPVPPEPPIGEDFPPEPRTIVGAGKGRRETRKYERISLTIDSNLWKLVQTDMEKLRVSAGRMIDVLLWRVYGRPKLSFEEAEIEPQEEGQAGEVDQPEEEPGREE
jgi:hypothetical protein